MMPAQWYAIRVRSNFEQSVAAGLRSREIEDFFPCYRVRKRWSDRVKEVTVPLFPGYLFGRFQPDKDFSRIVSTPGVVHVVGLSKGHLSPIDQEEIENVRLLVSSDLAINPCPYLNVGDRIRVKQGPLAGLEGLLIEIRKQCRVVVSVTILMRSVAVDIERDWIEPQQSRTAALAELARKQKNERAPGSRGSGGMTAGSLKG